MLPYMGLTVQAPLYLGCGLRDEEELLALCRGAVHPGWLCGWPVGRHHQHHRAYLCLVWQHQFNQA